jgi:hypothetical protein
MAEFPIIDQRESAFSSAYERLMIAIKSDVDEGFISFWDTHTRQGSRRHFWKYQIWRLIVLPAAWV